ncbi:DUF4232 domain-containing protein [Streptomyces sp. JV185]|uniref:DUF4232 domain-containing protein n=1 Tax=Streptomyces sp. JV185 TaxID=858638 RepID=UPI002E75E949|nr:DUF4232 domain-containing protein [Streptomyces sp. JV185]MEE1769765.1 DUF4232 domain-containing protein [Streptomyces sp. JV185]
MRTRARTRIAAAGALVALSALALTGCNSDDEADAAADSSASTAASPEASSGSGSNGGSSSNGGGSSSGGGITAACTTQNTSAQFRQSANHASESQAAAGSLRITNSSGAACTIVGPTVVTVTDEAKGSGPVSADNSEEGSDAVDIPAGGTATADVMYNDVNTEGTARLSCRTESSTVKVALPKDAGTTVNVMKADGSPGGVFSLCADSFKLGAFSVG